MSMRGDSGKRSKHGKGERKTAREVKKGRRAREKKSRKTKPLQMQYNTTAGYVGLGTM